MTSCNDCHPLANRPVVTTLDHEKLDGPRLDLAARKYVGTTFLHQGRNPEIGVDCVGLASVLVKDCGLHWLAEHDLTNYARNPNGGELERRMQAAFGPPVKELAPGCLVTIQFYGPTRHVGIVGEYNRRLTLIHALGVPPRVVEHGIDDKWLRRITGIYRVGGAA
jgi:hypothetical protein